MGLKGWGGNLDGGVVWGCFPVNAQGARWDCRWSLWTHRETNGTVLSLEMDQESSGIALVYVCAYEGCRRTCELARSYIFYILYSTCYIIYSIIYNLYSISYILYSIFYIFCSIFQILNSIFYILYSILYILNCILYIQYPIFYILYSTFYIP